MHLLTRSHAWHRAEHSPAAVCAGGQPPSQVQTNRDFPEFAVNLLDVYGSVVRTERGVCKVTGVWRNQAAASPDPSALPCQCWWLPVHPAASPPS